MSLALAEMTEKLISISEFSQGKAGKIFTDVAKNRSEYIVLKNNHPLFFLFFVFLRITKGRFYEKHKNAPHHLIKLTSSMYVYE